MRVLTELSKVVQGGHFLKKEMSSHIMGVIKLWGLNIKTNAEYF